MQQNQVEHPLMDDVAHGLAGVDLLSHEELLQLPDVHSGLGHGLWVPALRRTTVL